MVVVMTGKAMAVEKRRNISREVENIGHFRNRQYLTGRPQRRGRLTEAMRRRLQAIFVAIGQILHAKE